MLMAGPLASTRSVALNFCQIRPVLTKMPCKEALQLCCTHHGSFTLQHLHPCRLRQTRSYATAAAAAVQLNQTVHQASSLPPAARSYPAPTAAYVHLPFCKRRCFYCDFAIAVVGNRVEGPDASTRIQSYVDLLLREIDACAVVGDRPLSTVFFGGGTPSLVPPHLVYRILRRLELRYGLDPGAEVSMEADPGTFDAQRLRQYMDAGVTRFSIGVQSFQQELLESAGRAHGLQDVYRAMEALSTAGVTNWSLDLISGLPHLTMRGWAHSLQQVVQARPPHVSVYDLQVEDGTPFARRYTPGQAPLPTNDEAAEMYREASRVLTSSGYLHYELSNYALPGAECRHNLVYWRCQPYYAFGMAAASYLQGRRFTRPRRMADYTQWVEQFASGGDGGAGQFASGGEGGAIIGAEEAAAALPPRPSLVQQQQQQQRVAGGELSQQQQQQQRATEGELPQQQQQQQQQWVPGGNEPEETPEDRILENVMLRLRLAEGLDLDWLAKEFGEAACAQVCASLRRHQASGLVQFEERSDSGSDDQRAGDGGQQVASRVRLTDPEGLLVSNDIISDVFATVSSE